MPLVVNVLLVLTSTTIIILFSPALYMLTPNVHGVQNADIHTIRQLPVKVQRTLNVHIAHHVDLMNMKLLLAHQLLTESAVVVRLATFYQKLH